MADSAPRARCSIRLVRAASVCAHVVLAVGCQRSDAQFPAAYVTSATPTDTAVYAAAGIGGETAEARRALARVYAPNTIDHTVSVIDPELLRVVSTLPTGQYPEHVIVAHDLRSLLIASTRGNTLTRIDPATARADAPVAVEDPYNVYFTPDGRTMIVITERDDRLDFRNAATLALEGSVRLACRGANHLDFSADGATALVSCEFSSQLFRLNVERRVIEGYLTLRAPPHREDTLTNRMRSMPQDVRLSPNGRVFYVADMMADGLFVIAADSLRQVGFIPTGRGAHGIAVGRGGSPFYIANRGWHTIEGGRRGPGSVSVLDPIAGRVTATWIVPDGGSPDMGNVSADGKTVWFSGRYDDEVYAFDAESGKLRARIPVGRGPHGVAVWPLPGRYSLGHTGNMR